MRRTKVLGIVYVSQSANTMRGWTDIGADKPLFERRFQISEATKVLLWL